MYSTSTSARVHGLMKRNEALELCITSVTDVCILPGGGLEFHELERKLFEQLGRKAFRMPPSTWRYASCLQQVGGGGGVQLAGVTFSASVLFFFGCQPLFSPKVRPFFLSSSLWKAQGGALSPPPLFLAHNAKWAQTEEDEEQKGVLSVCTQTITRKIEKPQETAIVIDLKRIEKRLGCQRPFLCSFASSESFM